MAKFYFKLFLFNVERKAIVRHRIHKRPITCTDFAVPGRLFIKLRHWGLYKSCLFLRPKTGSSSLFFFFYFLQHLFQQCVLSVDRVPWTGDAEPTDTFSGSVVRWLILTGSLNTRLPYRLHSTWLMLLIFPSSHFWQNGSSAISMTYW